MKLISQLQAAGQDHEFYPTTNEILDALFRHHFGEEDEPATARFHGSVLDIGAGNGKVLNAFAKRGADTLYAIEKSPILQRELPARVLVIGTEFAEQSLHSKPVDLLFCNPPYSQFIGWMVKIIRTAAAKELYLVVPRRWQDNEEVKAAIRFRGVFLPDEKDPKEPPPEPEHLDTDSVEYRAWDEQYGPIRDRQGRIIRSRYYERPPRVTIVGEFDFEDAEDRKARAKVHLLHIPLQTSGKRGENDDAFERFFEAQFADLIARFKGQKEKPKSWEQPPAPTDRFPLVTGESYVEALVSCYYAELAKIEKNYNAAATLGWLRHETPVDAENVRRLLSVWNRTPEGTLEAIAEHEAKRLGYDYGDAFDQLQSAYSFYIEDYSTDSPGYVGPVFLVLWPASPGAVSTYIQKNGVWEHCNSSAW